MGKRTAILLALVVLIGSSSIVVVNVWPDQVYCGFLALREWAAIYANPYSYRATDELPRIPLPLSDPRLPDKTHFVVLPGTEIARMRLCFPKVSDVEGSWQPSPTDIDLLETGFRRFELVRAGGGYPSGVRVLGSTRTYRQYLPVIVRGKRLILVNAFVVAQSFWIGRRSHFGCFDRWISSDVLYDPATLEFFELSDSRTKFVTFY